MPSHHVTNRLIQRGVRALATRFLRSERGAVAVEAAIIGPMLALTVVGLGDTSIRVSDQQKLQAGAVAGAHYIRDVIDRGDAADFNRARNANGDWVPGQGTANLKSIVADAAGLNVAGGVTLDFSCGCLKADSYTPLDGEEDSMREEGESASPKDSDYAYVAVSQNVTLTKDAVCSTRCADGSTAAMLARIDIAYTASKIRGGTEVRAHSLTLRVG